MNCLMHEEIEEVVSKYKAMRRGLITGVVNTEKYNQINAQATMVDTIWNNCSFNIPPEHMALIEAIRDFDNFCFAIYDIVYRDEMEWENARRTLEIKFDTLKNAFEQIEWT